MPLRACAPCDPAFAPVASRRAVPAGSYVPKHRNAGRHGFRPCAMQTDTPAAGMGRPARPGVQPPPAGGLAPRSTMPTRIQTERDYLTQRAGLITRHFPNAMGMDDFMHRVEIALYAFGFSGDNSIGATWRGVVGGVLRKGGERGPMVDVGWRMESSFGPDCWWGAGRHRGTAARAAAACTRASVPAAHGVGLRFLTQS